MRRQLQALIVWIAVATLGGCTECIINPQGPIADAELEILFNTLDIILAIMILTIFAILAVSFWFLASSSRARYLPDFNYSYHLQVLVWSNPAVALLVGGLIWIGGLVWLGPHEFDPGTALGSTLTPATAQVVCK